MAKGAKTSSSLKEWLESEPWQAWKSIGLTGLKGSSKAYLLALWQEKIRGPVLDAALKTFKTLKLDQTASKNGVLIFIVPSSRQFAILGDKGINDIVPENFWDDIILDLQTYFKADKMVEGLCLNIEKIGEKLKTHFPYQSNDQNELPDEISFDKIKGK